MKRLLLALALLPLLDLANTLVPARASGGGLVQSCPEGPLSPDGSIITPPTKCVLNTVTGAYAFGGLYGSSAYGFSVLRNGSVLRDVDGTTYSGVQAEVSQGGRYFLKMRPFTSVYASATDCTSPASFIWMTYANDGAGNPLTQTIGPGSPLVSPGFVVNNATAYYSMKAATNALTSSGILLIPAPPTGSDYWLGAGTISHSRVTVIGAVGAALECATDLGTGAINVAGNLNRVTIRGNSAINPLSISSGTAGPSNGPFSALHIAPGVTGGLYRYLLLHDSDNCFESAGGGGAWAISYVTLKNCGSDAGSGAGFNHNAYVGWDIFTILPDTDDVTVSHVETLDGRAEAHLWKSRVAKMKLTSFTAGCESSILTNCQENAEVDIPCGGDYSLSHVVLERAPGARQRVIVDFGEEVSSVFPSNCPEVRGTAGEGTTTARGKTITGLITSPIALAWGAGDDISPCDNKGSCSAAFPLHSTIASVTSNSITLACASCTNAATGISLMVAGPVHFTGKAVAGDTKIKGVDVNPAPTGERNYPAVGEHGIWPGYVVKGTGIPPDCHVTSTTGVAGSGVLNLDCTIASNPGRDFTADRVQRIDMSNCIIINDGPDIRGATEIGEKAGIIPATFTIHDCKLVDNPNASAMIAGIGVTLGESVTRYVSRAKAAAAFRWAGEDKHGNKCCAFPWLPPTP